MVVYRIICPAIVKVFASYRVVALRSKRLAPHPVILTRVTVVILSIWLSANAQQHCLIQHHQHNVYELEPAQPKNLLRQKLVWRMKKNKMGRKKKEKVIRRNRTMKMEQVKLL